MGSKKRFIIMGLVLILCTSLLPAKELQAAISKDTTWYFMAASNANALYESVTNHAPAASQGQLVGYYPSDEGSDIINAWPDVVMLGGADVLFMDKNRGLMRHIYGVPSDCVYGSVSLNSSGVSPEEIERIVYIVELYDVTTKLRNEKYRSYLDPVDIKEVETTPLEMVDFKKLVPMTNPSTQFYIIDKVVYAKDGNHYYPGATTVIFQKNASSHVLGLKSDEEIDNSLEEVYRLYNPNNGAHMYTKDAHEKDVLKQNRWNDEGLMGKFPKSGDPIYRLYNPETGQHLFTTDKNEVKVLTEQGPWKNESMEEPAFYSSKIHMVGVYRLYNPAATSALASHHYTSDDNEVNTLVKNNWQIDNQGQPLFYAYRR